MKRALGTALGVAIVLAACDEFSKTWLVDRTRIVGVQVEALAEPTRASLAPGEPARVTWLVVDPRNTPRLGWAFASCAPPPGTRADAKCEGPILGSGSGAADGERVSFTIEAPGASMLGAENELLLLGAFCSNADARLDPAAFTATCSDGKEPLLASATVRIDAALKNHAPPLRDDGIRLNGVVLPPAVATSVGPCVPSAEAPRVVAGAGDLGFGYRFDDADREPNGATKESLVLTSLVTDGELDRAYSAFDPEETAPSKEVTIAWTPPGRDAIGPEGKLVRVFFVLRDDRGGTSFATRGVCVVPE